MILIPCFHTTAIILVWVSVSTSNVFGAHVRLTPLWQRGGFSGLRSLAFDNTGALYTVDESRNALEKFFVDGTRAKQVIGTGREQYQFDQPVSVDARFGVDVIVADYGNRRIERYTRELTHMGTVADPARAGLRSLGHPRSVCQSRFGDILVNDFENKRILRFDVSGGVAVLAGAELPAPRNVANASWVTCDENDIVWILSDEKKPTLKKFDLFGASLGAVGPLFDSTIDAIAIAGKFMWYVSSNTLHIADLNTGADISEENMNEEFGGEKIFSLAVMTKPGAEEPEIILALASRVELRMYSCRFLQ